MNWTHPSCSTIMPQKKAKMQPGAMDSAASGKNVVSSAAEIQCVKLPGAWPSERGGGWGRFLSSVYSCALAPSPIPFAHTKDDNGTHEK